MSLLEHTPNFSLADAASLALEGYRVRAIAAELPSERDQNFLLTTDHGERFVLKIANALEDRSLLEAQNQAMVHVAHLSLCPTVVPTVEGEAITSIASSTGANNLVRMLTYLSGTPLASV